MLIDEIREQLKALEGTIATITTFWNNATFEADFQALSMLSSQEHFWQNPEQASILKRLQAIRQKREQYLAMLANQRELAELVNLFADDERELESLEAPLREHERSVNRLKLLLLLGGEDDEKNCFLSINAGAGGTESQDWSEMLLRMYLRFCEHEGFSVTVVDYQTGEEAGIKSATLFIRGRYAYGFLKSEQGIHRLVRISPYDANKRRHTSFAGVFVTPEAPDVSITINPQDLRIDTYRAGGAGGQHVNKTDSAVRITHIPTNIVVQCQSERSQTQNKETAMKMLAAKLLQKEREEARTRLSSVEKKKIEWGSQIRSYVLHPYKLVKDHRTDLESPQPELVLDGKIMDFIEAYLSSGAS